MNKVTLQAFSAGLIVSTTIFAGFYYMTEPNEETGPTVEEAKKLLNEKGYLVSLQKDERLNSEKEEKRIDKEEKKQEKEVPKKNNPVVSYTLEVKANMTTLEIATKLEKEKIIDDAARFESYVEDQGFSKNIQIGEFVVTDNMTYRQLAKTLTQ
ncbi:hypothetical protein ACQKL0_07085 [Peribacillus sp. NPDC097264]|uniref:hypothetical protein n=1 Tax=unclassified Peribacillus TaxID=2675266 RepID=UPI003805EDD4